MPYVEKKVGKGKMEVYNTKTHHIAAKHTTKTKADRQMRLLNTIERVGYKPSKGRK